MNDKLMKYFVGGTIKEFKQEGDNASLIVEKGGNEYLFEVKMHRWDDDADISYKISKRIVTYKNL